MIVKHLEEVTGTGQEVGAATWTSRRLLLRRDGMGFSMHDTVMFAGTETHMWYQHHLEAVYCIEGEGELEDLKTGKKYQIRPGTLYALNENDEHIMRAKSQLRMVCVFNPPLSGKEVHDENGVYPLIEDGGAQPANS